MDEAEATTSEETERKTIIGVWESESKRRFLTSFYHSILCMEFFQFSNININPNVETKFIINSK